MAVVPKDCKMQKAKQENDIPIKLLKKTYSYFPL